MMISSPIYIIRDSGFDFDLIVATLNAYDNFPSLKAIIKILLDFEFHLSIAHEINSVTSLHTHHLASTQDENRDNHPSRSQQKYKGNRGGGRSQTPNPHLCSQSNIAHGGGHTSGI